MNDVLIESITQWGTAGVFVLAGGFLLYDNWKKTKKFEQFFMDKLVDLDHHEPPSYALEAINSKLDTIHDDYCTLKEEIDSLRSDTHSTEAIRLHAVSKIAPSIHTLINDGPNTCNCDHIAVALLHNGSTALSGIPYIKFGVIAEKYNPLQFPGDIDLVLKYKDVDIVSHNRLPSCMLHTKSLHFNIAPDCQLADIDPIIYNNCVKLGIKQIAFEVIRDAHNLATGFMIAYSFTRDPIDMDALHTTTSTIEDLYREMLAGFNA